MKELTLDEISLLEEMKSNCLKKGQYIDEKAKDKFKMLCHLEDFGIAYYELLDVIKEVREYIENTPRVVKSTHYRDKESNYAFIENYVKGEILEKLDKVNNVRANN